MAQKIPRWLIYSGVGCLLVVLVGVGLVVAFAFVLRDAVQSFEQADRTMETVVEQYGPVEAFHPLPGGAIPGERMDAFLAVREKMSPAREGLDETLGKLSGEGGALGKVMAGAYLLHRLSDFVDERHRGLLEAEMGLGEYYYVYTLAYFSWLGKQPEDGPPFKLVGESGYVMETADDLDEVAAHAHRLEHVRQSLNRLLVPVLNNQLADLADDEVGGEWAERLSAEIEAMKADSVRLPWQDGLPQAITSSLEPYRERLEASYSPLCNALEVGLARR